MNFLAKIDSKRIDAAGDINITAGALSITTDGSNKATLTESGSGDFEIHAADDLRLNADGHDIVLKGASNEFGRLANSSQNFIIKNITADKDIIFQADDGTGSAVTEYFRIDGGLEQTVVSKNFRFDDSVQAMFGSNIDLRIYHNGSNSYIQDSGTGELRMLASTLSVRNSGDTELMITAIEDGAVNLYHDNSKKLETTSDGVSVTGKVVTTEIESASTIL